MMFYYKKLAAAALALVISAGLGSRAYAEGASEQPVSPEPSVTSAADGWEGPIWSREEAEERARLWPFVQALKIGDIQAGYSQEGKVWDLDFAMPGRDANGNPTGSVHVRLSGEDGSILYVYVSERSGLVQAGRDASESEPGLGSQPGDLTGEDAVQAARTFIEGMGLGLDAVWIPDPQPESAYETRTDDKLLHKVRFIRTVNGIPQHYSDRSTVYVDRAGKVVYYAIQWSRMNYPDPSLAISKEKAEGIFYDKSVPVLYYLPSGNGSAGPRLVYSLWRQVMHAETGEFPADRNTNPHPGSGSLKPVSEFTPKLPEIEAEPDDGSNYSLRTEPGLAEEEARSIAVSYLQEKMPAYADELAENNVYLVMSNGVYATTPLYRFRFDRIAGGIAVDQWSLDLDVHAFTGKVLSAAGLYWDPAVAFQAEPMLTVEQAKRRLMSLYDVELQYLPEEPGRAELYYRLMLDPSVPRFYTGSGPYLDAVTGEWVYMNGETVQVPVPTDSSWVDQVVSSPERIGYEAAVVMDGELLKLDPEPILRMGRTLVPLRGVFEKLGAQVSWEDADQRVTVVKGDLRLELTIGSTTVYRNGKPHDIPVPAWLEKGRTYVPARFVAEAFGAQVDWVADSRLVLIRTGGALSDPTEEQLQQWRLAAQMGWEERQ